MLSLRCLEGFQIKHFKNLVCLLNFFSCVCRNWIWSLFLQIMGIVPFTTGNSIGICTSLQILCWEITTTPTANNVERRVPEIRHDPVLVSTKIYSKVRFSWQFFYTSLMSLKDHHIYNVKSNSEYLFIPDINDIPIRLYHLISHHLSFYMMLSAIFSDCRL